ncbi:uncharacterized protein [Eurosta solidaginis]|uniref:uncharacterized protein isoform X2 n=1 Tax=Eurosta solidaginis TaxID=178769 RepID=UPI00353109F2
MEVPLIHTTSRRAPESSWTRWQICKPRIHPWESSLEINNYIPHKSGYFSALFHVALTKTTSWALVSNHQKQQDNNQQQQRYEQYFHNDFLYEQEREENEEHKSDYNNNYKNPNAHCIDCGAEADREI